MINDALHMGLHIPNDLIVLGCDNDPIEDVQSEVPISTLSVDFDEVGYQAAALLEQMLTRKTRVPAETKIPPGAVVQRRSTQGVTTTDADLQNAIQWMREHCHEPTLAVAEIAEASFLSRRVLERRFFAQLRCSPAQMLLDLRLQLVREMLATGRAAIAQVARSSGFSSEYAFSRVFRREMAMTPSAYRAQYRQ